MNKGAWLGVMCGCLLSAGGCAVSGKQVAKRQVAIRDSVRVERLESVGFQRIREASGQARLRLREVTFSVPDSAGRQYVRAVKTAEWEAERHGSSTDMLRGTVSRLESRRSDVAAGAVDIQKSVRNGPFRGFRFRVLGLLLLAAGAVWVWKRRSAGGGKG